MKRSTPILVIIGNPPYNGFAGVAQDEESELMKAYYQGLASYGVQVRGLNDLYVRFFRLAERRIGEVGKRGIVSFISNNSWLDGQSHPVMRERILKEFEVAYIDNCNGDKYRTGKRTPEGKPDQSMFTTDSQPVGIQVGTAIATLINTTDDASSHADAGVYYRDLWGYANDKRATLLSTLAADNVATLYENLAPDRSLRYILTPSATASGYTTWASLPEVFAFSSPGVQTARDELVVDIDRDALVSRMRRYFDANISNSEMAAEAPCALTETERFPASQTRAKLQARGFLPDKIVPFAYRPLDNRWLYWEPEGKLLDEKRSDYFAQCFPGNIAITAAASIRKGEVEGPVPISMIGSRHLIERGANVFPKLHRVPEGPHLGVVEPNVKAKVLESMCEARGAPTYRDDGHTYTETAVAVADCLFFHIVAILWSPAYRSENEAALRQDWPRVPIPCDAPPLEVSARLGRTVTELLLPDNDVPGITKGTIRPELRTMAIPTRIGGGTIDEGSDTRVDAGWGFFGQRNAVMCGKGIVTPNKEDPDTAVDLWINDAVYWANVPKDVWAMTIGGYPVIKKWLSYRDHRVLGRPLKTDELFYITQVVRRLKALLLLGPDLDANYRACAAATQVTVAAK